MSVAFGRRGTRRPVGFSFRKFQLFNCVLAVMAKYSTITLSVDTKRRLALVKGDRSWDDFLGEVAAAWPADDAIGDLEKRLRALRTRHRDGARSRRRE